MTRTRATALHLAICVIIAGVLWAYFQYVIYPAPLFQAVGGDKIFLMLLGIDVVLGPLLTFIVFKQGKRTLKFDLSVIAFVQICALAYGVQALYAGRPVFLAALGHRFDAVQASDVAEENIIASGRSLPKFGPELTGIKIPEDKKIRNQVMDTSLFAGQDYGHYPQYHAKLESMRDEILSRSQPISELKTYNPGREGEIDEWLSSRKLKPIDVKFQALKARAKDMTVMISAQDGSVIELADFTPWK